jgi:hypothetical protein
MFHTESAEGGGSTSFQMDAPITFIPAMLDGSCGTSPSKHKQTVLGMVFMETMIMARNMWCIPEMIRSMINMGTMQSMLGSWRNTRDFILQCMLALIETCMLIMVFPAFLVMPGLAFTVLCIGSASVVTMISWPLYGEQVIRCTAKGQQNDDCMDERWIYINGAMTRFGFSIQLQSLADNILRIATINCAPNVCNYLLFLVVRSLEFIIKLAA